MAAKLTFLTTSKATEKQKLKYTEWIGLNDYRLGKKEEEFYTNHMNKYHHAWLSGYRRGQRDKKTTLQVTNIFRSYD